MNARAVAFTTSYRGQSAVTSDKQRFYRKALMLQHTEQIVQADTMTADYDQVGGSELPSE